MSKTCIITGASRGIGRAIAISLSEREDISNFILIARTEAGLHETARLMKTNKNVELYPIDLTAYDEVSGVVEQIATSFGFRQGEGLGQSPKLKLLLIYLLS